ncbi:MAG: hypothetical protein R2827_12310 [Bdellovibrionales bacterium]
MSAQVPILEMIDVTIELGGQVILANVSLKIEKGESVVIGPSGHGKTVLPSL